MGYVIGQDIGEKQMAVDVMTALSDPAGRFAGTRSYKDLPSQARRQEAGEEWIPVHGGDFFFGYEEIF